MAIWFRLYVLNSFAYLIKKVSDYSETFLFFRLNESNYKLPIFIIYNSQHVDNFHLEYI